MLVLHGIYDNGKIEIEEKDLPKVRAEVEIRLKKPHKKRIFHSISKIKVNTYEFKFKRDEANAR